MATPPGAPLGRIGPYEVLRELARGGMGIVYVARRPGLDRHVALKVLLGDAATPAQVERFQGEARMAARLRHPGIVAIHDVGVDRGRPYLVMDLIEGQSLHARLAAGGPFDPRPAAELALRLAQALAFAHARGVLHRDLKPHNVLLGAQGEPVITDFGLAKDVSQGPAAGLTKTGEVLGTPSYMAPEQAAGELDQVDRRADLYALGATLYEALVGQPPFVGPTPINVITQVLSKEPRPVREHRPEVDPDLETIVLTCLEKEPERRYRSATALAEDLERYLKDEPIAARPPSLRERGRRWARRHQGVARVLVAAAALVAGTVALAGAWVLRARGEAAAARRGERERLVAAHREAAERAWTAAADAAGDPADAAADPAAVASGAAATADAGLAAALRALQAAQTWRGLAEDDPAARAACARAAGALAEAACRGAQWALALEAAGQVGALAGAEEGGRLRARVEAARGAEVERRLAEARRTLAEVESGAAARRLDGLRAAVFALVRDPRPETVALLAAALDGVTEALRGAELAFYRTAERLAPGEEGPACPDLRAAWEARAAWPPAASAEATALLERAERRLLARAARRPDAVAGTKLGLVQLVAAAQAAELPPGRRDVARVVVEALGRVGRADLAAEAVARHLRAQADEARAAEAAVALCLLAPPDAARVVLAVADRFPQAGPYALAARQALGALPPAPLEGASVDDLVREAHLRLARGDHGGSLECLTRALALEPGRTDLLGLRARHLRLAGRSAQALADLDRALARTPDDAALLAERALTRRLLPGEAARALADASRAVELRPGLADGWVARSLLASDQGRATDAEADARRAVALAPGAQPARSALVVGLLQGGRLDEALAEARAALEATRDAETLALLAQAHARRGEAAEALAAAEAALELDPDHLEGLFARAGARADVGRDAQALEDYDRCLAAHPTWAHALANRALVHERLGHLDRALADLDQALALTPESAPTWVNRGLLHRRRGDLARAVEDLRRAVALGPRLPAAWLNLGLVLAERREPVEALAALGTCLELAPDLVEALRIRFMVQRDAGDRAAALRDLDRAVALAPADAGLWLERGNLRLAEGDPAGAQADYDRAIAADPGRALAWNNRGHVRRERGDAAGARADLDRAIALDPGLVLALGNRADLRRAGGDLAGALEDWAAALRVRDDPDVRWARGSALLLAGRRDEALADLSAAARTDAWAALWVAGLTGRLEVLTPFAGRDDVWVSQLARFVLGRLDEAALLRVARAAPDPARAATQEAEARCYVGLVAERRGDAAAARAAYRACAALGRTSLHEDAWARVRLAALGE